MAGGKPPCQRRCRGAEERIERRVAVERPADEQPRLAMITERFLDQRTVIQDTPVSRTQPAGLHRCGACLDDAADSTAVLQVFVA